ncbi:uncharacterized protein LOC123694406 isoform X2 [Colias croceus]|uniref:uncharacterized protein LOC123694406 isoform X2 n=1 Tax=Colias crocea TaxID=72248 RepID=UPI001E28182B|nr:uncharacterized protein LOC123694406 isoform X2 [Colias croceus]
MYRNYVDNFLKKTNASYVERYSDSSDFDYPVNIPPVTAKRGNHLLLNDYGCNTDQREKYSMIGNNSGGHNCQVDKGNITKRFQKMIAYKQSKHTMSADKNCKRNQQMTFQEHNYYKSRGDQSSRHNIAKMSSKSLLLDKVLPRFSTIFRRSNYPKEIEEEEEREPILTAKCANCERKRIKKLNKTRQCYAIQPNFAFVGNIHDVPIRYHQTSKQNSPLSHNSMNRNPSINRCCLTSSSGSEIIIPERVQNDVLYNNKKTKNKKIQYEYETVNCHVFPEVKQNKHLQYPSKHMKPYQIYANSSCQAKTLSGHSVEQAKIPSSSSSFWDYVADKIKSKSKKPCSCEPPSPPHCTLDSCEILNPKVSNENKLMSPKPRSTGEMPSSPPKLKAQLECKCTNTKSQDKDEALTSCQEPHDVITKNLIDKYKGQILCIHNPPCILINGCLNLPPPKPTGMSNVWRLSSSKRSSFREESKSQKYIENGCQYQPPDAVQECLPEFQTEKIVQSICNHDPPCEVVRRCYKPKYETKYRDSCVHVPMCKKLPECLITEGQTDEQEVECSHSPKCAEVHTCSKKFMTLTAKEDTSTQVKAKMRMVCRHEPPCLMIPKCIGRVICTESVPCDAIPDCVHHPCCEYIPACCRRAAKEMPSLTSNEEGISLKVPRIPLQQKNRLLRLIQAKRQF